MLRALKLIVPVIGAREQTVYDAHQTDACRVYDWNPPLVSVFFC
jgi:hypothetical protein